MISSRTGLVSSIVLANLIFFCIDKTAEAQATTSRNTIAVTLNSAGLSTSTSNPIEAHIRNGVELAISELYPSKSNFEIKWLNHGESITQTLDAIEKINSGGYPIVVGMESSSQALLCAQRMNKQTLLISPVATSDEILNQSSNIALLSNPNSVQVRLIISEFLQNASETDKLLIVELAGCPYCTDLAKRFHTVLSAINKKVDVLVLHEQSLGSLTELPNKHKGYAHIFLPVLESNAARVIDYLYPENKNALFWGTDGWGTLGRYVQTLPFAKSLKAKWVTNYHPDVATKENIEFKKHFERRFGMSPVDTSAFFYESMLLAIQNKNLKSPEEFFRRIQAKKYFKGLTGRSMYMNRHALRPMPLLSIINGRVQLIKTLTPEELKK